MVGYMILAGVISFGALFILGGPVLLRIMTENDRKKKE